MTNYKFSEDVAILATIDPDAYTASSYTSDWADVEYFEAFQGVLFTGTIAASATLAFVLLQAKNSTGGSVKAITNANIVALAAATTNSDKQYTINIRADQLDVAGGFHFLAAKATLAVATSDFGAAILGFKVKHGPASGHDLASVTQIVTV